jgi:hypothetical protein
MTATLPDHGAIVEAVLEGFVGAAMALVQAGIVPPFPHMASVTYEAENGEEWLLPNQVIARGKGDCEDLSIWTAAGYRVTGQDPGAYCTLRMTGPKEIHCIVQLSDGTTVDPSLQMRRLAKQRQVSLGAAPNVVVRENRKMWLPDQVRTAAPPGAPPPAAAYGGTPKTPGVYTMPEHIAAALVTQKYARDIGDNPRSLKEGFGKPTPGKSDPNNYEYDPTTGAWRRPGAGQYPVDPYTGLPVGQDPYANPYGYGYPYPQSPYQPYMYPYQQYQMQSYQYQPGLADMLFSAYPREQSSDYGMMMWPSAGDVFGQMEYPPEELYEAETPTPEDDWGWAV